MEEPAVIEPVNEKKVSAAIRGSHIALAVYIVTLLSTVAYFGVRYGRGGGAPDLAFKVLLALIGAEIFGGAAFWFYCNRKLGRESRLLAETASVAQIPALLDAYSAIVQDERALIVETLLRLLPQVREEHSDLFQSRHRSFLRAKCDALLASQYSEPERESEWFSAIFEALPHIGTSEELEWVDKTLERDSAKERILRIKEMAMQCRPALEARVARLNNRNTLLRASSVPSDGADVLLRPATPQSAPAEELLRPMQGERK